MEDLAQLKAAVETKRWWKNTMRTSIKPKTESHIARGWRHLKEGVYSNTVREGPILQLVQKILGDEITDVCCNRNVTCHPHRDKANTSARSFFLMWGDFEGGALNVDELGKIRRITEKDVWHSFNGQRDLHWNDPHTGNKFSVVAFTRRPPNYARSKINAGSSEGT